MRPNYKKCTPPKLLYISELSVLSVLSVYSNSIVSNKGHLDTIEFV